MPDTFTANYNFVKPEVNASRDTWGTKWNANIDSIDGILKSLSNNKLQYNPTDKTSSAEVNFTGVAPKIAGKEIATKEFVTSSISSALPSGCILMWKGTIATIPAGWALCNGQNGTPNLQDRFVIAAGSGYAPGAVGGATQVALVEWNMPAHQHTFNVNTSTNGHHGHSGTARSAGGHNHSVSVGSQNVFADRGDGSNGNWVSGGGSISTSTVGGHTHTLDIDAAGNHVHNVAGSTDWRGSGGAFSIMNPYYALAFIMKL